MLSQQQKVTKSKYLIELGHAAVNQSNADDIINAATTQGIYDLILGLSDKERQVLVASKAHEASAITYGEAKEGAVEAHNFSSKVSVTTVHLSNERKRGATSVASAKMLKKLVLSINTSKVTEDGTENRSNGEEEGSNNGKNPNASKRVAIEGMQIVSRKQKKAVLFDTASAAKEENNNEGGTNDHSKNIDNKDNQGDKIEGGRRNEGNNNQSKEGEEADNNGRNSEEVDNSGMEEDQDNGEGEDASGEEEEREDSDKLVRINATMTANMISALAQLNTCLDEGEDNSLNKEEESFLVKDRRDPSGDHDLSLGKYNPDAIEISLGIFNAEHSKKYQTPNISCRHCGIQQALLLEA
jgi:hypothetical protein